VNLDITWLKYDSHVAADHLPAPDVLAYIIDDLEAAPADFEESPDELDEGST